MAYDFDGTNDFIEAAAIPSIDVPVTMACWFNSDTNTAQKIIMALAAASISAGETLSPGFSLRLTSGTANIQAVISSGTGTNSSQSGTTFAVGVWNHATGKFASATSRTVYLNGISGPESTPNRSLGAVLDNLLIGKGSGGVYLPSIPFNGRLAEVAVWNAALNDDEITSLSKGIKPIYVRPQSLLYYIPLVREIKDEVSAVGLTFLSPTAFVHTRRYG